LAFQETNQIPNTINSFRFQLVVGGGFPQDHPYFAEKKGCLKDRIDGTLRQENITILISETRYKNSLWADHIRPALQTINHPAFNGNVEREL
jgi:hypothetical protein